MASTLTMAANLPYVRKLGESPVSPEYAYVA